jgi:hypothetical protein
MAGPLLLELADLVAMLLLQIVEQAPDTLGGFSLSKAVSVWGMVMLSLGIYRSISQLSLIPLRF